MSTQSEPIYNVTNGNLYTRVHTESNELIHALRKEAGDDILEFISVQFPLNKREKVLYISNNSQLYDQVDYNNIQAIINLQPMNSHVQINKLLNSFNKLLPVGGCYIGCVETYQIRKEKVIKKYGKRLYKPFWFADFLFHRVMPRIKYTQKLYKFLTGNKHIALSQAEALGRLVYCGFEINEVIRLNNLYFFSVKKKGNPQTDKHISNGLFFPMRRVGKKGKLIKVFKVRTMHPYSEFIQDFVLRQNGYDQTGKPANDFRVTGWGKIMRKLWLDEIPQFLNVLKGEMGIVGVRPLSQVRYNQFPEDMKIARIKYKPGCIPPYVALCMPDDKGNIEAERIYLKDKAQNPYFTNLRYFFKAVYNILTNKIRSN